MLKICITGYEGRIGRLLLDLGCLPLRCDVTKYEEVLEAIEQEKPSIVAHLASISDVDYCELPDHRDEVLRVNYRGTANLASVCFGNKVPMVFLSTDHIFNGKKGPYKEDYPFWHRSLLGKFESPVNYYGLSKLTAEAVNRAFPMKVVRTSYLFNKERMDLKLQDPDHPTFIFRSFMYSKHFAEVFWQYLNRFFEMPEVLNISGSVSISWYDFMLAYASIFGQNKELIVPRTKEVKRHAPRPRKAGLNTKLSASLGLPQYSYLDGLWQMKYEEDINSHPSS